MTQKSIIYKNIYIYRILLNLIYQGRYKSRFHDITRLLDRYKCVLELCFGDIYIANYCRNNNIDWTGYDINQSFVDHAKHNNYNAFNKDILTIECLPKCEVVIIQGSLYHFHQDIDLLFSKIFAATNTIILSEPIKNFSSAKGIIGWLARRSANAGNGNEAFRYSEETIIKLLNDKKLMFSFEFAVVSKKRDITILIKTI